MLNFWKESGKDSQEKKKNHIKGLLVAATDCEPQYLIRLLQVANRTFIRYQLVDSFLLVKAFMIIFLVGKVAYWIGRADSFSCIGSSCCIYPKRFYTTSKHPVSFRRGELLSFRSGNMLPYVRYSDTVESLLCICLPKVNVLEKASPSRHNTWVWRFHVSWQFLWC